jgi:hypothetical protein
MTFAASTIFCSFQDRSVVGKGGWRGWGGWSKIIGSIFEHVIFQCSFIQKTTDGTEWKNRKMEAVLFILFIASQHDNVLYSANSDGKETQV